MQGRLLFGIAHEGKQFFDFSVHLLTLGDECKALETIEAMGIGGGAHATPTPADKMLIDLAYLAVQVDFDGLDSATLTPEFLLEHLTTDDYMVIQEAIMTLRKKRIAVSENLSAEQAHNEDGNTKA